MRQAIAEGCDAVIACGGDGTIHDALQGVVGTQVALGVIPLGTANSLAKDLRMPLSPAKAARTLLGAKPRRIAVGRITCQKLSGESVSRYFTVTAGIGVDAEVFQRFSAEKKYRLGHFGYYVEAAKLWLTHPLHHFAAKIKTSGGKMLSDVQVSQLLAVRIRNFGGLLRQLAPGASLERNDLRVVLFRTRSRAAYLSYAMRGAFGGSWSVSGIELIDAESVLCEPLPGEQTRTFVEADGELLGTLPAEISIVPDALSLLMP